MKTMHTLIMALLLAGAIAGCGTVARPNVAPQDPSDFDPCQDHYLLCRDRCAPREVKEASCYRDHNGQVHKVCECKETINPDTRGADTPSPSQSSQPPK